MCLHFEIKTHPLSNFIFQALFNVCSKYCKWFLLCANQVCTFNQDNSNSLILCQISSSFKWHNCKAWRFDRLKQRSLNVDHVLLIQYGPSWVIRICISLVQNWIFLFLSEALESHSELFIPAFPHLDINIICLVLQIDLSILPPSFSHYFLKRTRAAWPGFLISQMCGFISLRREKEK